ncbi:type II CAAX prenyl endopeptidase Rce1 family protein [Oxalobacteraceae bacterium A2-2]
MKDKATATQSINDSQDAGMLLPVFIPGLIDNPTTGKALLIGSFFSLLSVPMFLAFSMLESNFWPHLSSADPPNWPLIAVLAIFFAPWFETYVFQRFPMEWIGYSTRSRRVIGVVTSATLFAAAHNSYGKPLVYFTAGLLLSCVYLASRGAGKRIATTATISAHLAQNILLLALVAWDPI